MNASSEHLHIMIEMARLGTWDSRPDAQDLNWSSLAKSFFGIPEGATVTYDMFLQGVHPEDRERVHSAIQRAMLADVRECSLECRTIGLDDGEERTLELRGRVLFDADRKPERLLCVFRDITKQKTFELELQRAWGAADAAGRAKTEFLAHMSHEIRTPLGAMLGFAELARDPNLGVREREESLKKVSRNGEQLLLLINKILDLSKIEADKLEIEKDVVPIEDIFSDVDAALRLNAQRKGIEVSFRSKGLVPRTITTDSLRIKQILINLVGNAIKFSEKGRVEVTVEMERPPRMGERIRLLFLVKDTGIGISLEQQPRLFKSFSQADSSMSRKYGGTGLGLVLSRKFARALGGNLYLAESAPGAGSTFAFTITDSVYGKDTELVSIRGCPHEVGGAAVRQRIAPDLRGIRVLLAEDAQDNQILVSRFLGMAGASVDVAQNGEEAIRMVEATDYDVVLMDLQMPVLDGYGATEALRHLGYEKPIIALTAHAMRGEKERCLSIGFDDHLTKPIDRGSLLEEVAEFARNKEKIKKEKH